MMTKLAKNKITLSLLTSLSCITIGSLTYAGAFQLHEQDAKSLGTYYAGAGAKADDAATEYYNPAGMVRLKHTSISTGLSAIALTTYFKGHMSLIDPDPVTALAHAQGSGNTFNIVPNVHIVYPFAYKGHQMAFGFGVTTPYGLSTIYPKSSLKDGSIGLGGTNTTIETINIGPNYAIALAHHLSLGLGIDFMLGTADYNGDLGFPDSHYTNHLEGTGWGYNAGVLWQPTTATRFGFAYRSKITINASGLSTANDPLFPIKDRQAKASFSIPADLTLSAYHDMSSKWAVMSTLQYTQWSAFKSLTISNMAEPTLHGHNMTVLYDYKDSWFGSVGTKYWINEHNGLSVGLGYDQTPTRDGHRDIRLPDSNRWAISTGWEYKMDQKMDFSLGYAYVDMANAKINNSKSGGPPYERGLSTGHANVVGIQFNYTFA